MRELTLLLAALCACSFSIVVETPRVPVCPAGGSAAIAVVPASPPAFIQGPGSAWQWGLLQEDPIGSDGTGSAWWVECMTSQGPLAGSACEPTTSDFIQL